MNKTVLSIALLLLASSAGSADKIPVRPGLWEVTATSLLLAMVPHIPPDQMQMLTSLAEQHGIDMPRIQNGAVISKVCVTQQMAEQEIPAYFHQEHIGCSVKNTTRTENGYKMDIVCANPRLEGSGTAEGTFTNPESFTGQTEFNGTLQGKPINDQVDMTGQWISASCGTIEPFLY
ncbi:MAG: DUF3617 domain-containing protein [Nitrosospira sp.]|nr:DUF3617 domain-containing protein [Nitrosospira sp.]